MLDGMVCETYPTIFYDNFYFLYLYIGTDTQRKIFNIINGSVITYAKKTHGKKIKILK